ncbi:uncharacterized protein LOC106669383 [Cimex lectularius]|uniref:Uncharacterized protein n=1 Tax=Cimex lectularius TaxID=79782 RepID=A0A8I6RXR2_CIMLE|nr:uncharacterized protein LOC106669383 [Cimex lectularius]
MARKNDAALLQYFYSNQILKGMKHPEVVSESFSLVANLLDLISEIRESIDSVLFQDLRKMVSKRPKDLAAASRKIISEAIETKGVEECSVVYKRAKQNISVNNRATAAHVVFAWSVVESIVSLASETAARLTLFENDGKTYIKKGSLKENNDFCFFGRSAEIEDLTELFLLEESVFLNSRGGHKETTAAANIVVGFVLREAEIHLKSRALDAHEKFAFLDEPVLKHSVRKSCRSEKKETKNGILKIGI